MKSCKPSMRGMALAISSEEWDSVGHTAVEQQEQLENGELRS